ncbi:coproporphyrinogen III oxidase family protein [Thermodesulfobacteriota bacterium]
MLVESCMTAFLKRKFSSLLQLTDFGSVSPPVPETGKEYLLYVHIPFCEELCPYCSFHRFQLDNDLARTYFDALRQEIRMYDELGFDFTSVYVGGGTPTVLPDEMGRLLDSLHKRFNIKEISLETNPNHLVEPIMDILRDGGVKRLSVGVQSFDDSLLKTMERYHKYGSGKEIRDKLEALMGTFDTLNVDMIFNFPTQTLEMLDTDLSIIEEINADQVTFYPLMVSDITRKELSGRFGTISYRQERLFYNRIIERLGDNYKTGTAWCLSRKESMIDEYVVDYDEYVGVGSGSFGYVNGAVMANTFSIPDYLEGVKAGRFPLEAKKVFSEKERIQYDFMMKLFGISIDLDAVEKKFNGRFCSTMGKEIMLFRLLGALEMSKDRLSLTRRGRYLWVIMMREFFTGVNNFRDICRARIGNPNHCAR